MGFADYHFVTQWKIQGQASKIFDILKDGESYACWWKPAYLKTEKTGPQKVHAWVKAKLPYVLDFETELMREIPDRQIELKATGELSGQGLWTLKPEGPSTIVTFHWDVTVTKPWMKRLSFLLKPIFRWNHDWVMKTGGVCLQKRVSSR